MTLFVVRYLFTCSVVVKHDHPDRADIPLRNGQVVINFKLKPIKTIYSEKEKVSQ